MANIKQAKKRARQSEQRRLRNKSQRSYMRTAIKNTLVAVASGDKAKAQEAFRAAAPVIDSSVTKGLIHKNKAARHKSRLSQRINSL